MRLRKAAFWRPLLGLLAGAACSGDPVGVELSLPADLVPRVRWFEVAAYKGAKCSTLDPKIASGLPDGATARIAFKNGETAPAFGELPNDRYAFAAVARDDTCTVLATGCKEVAIDDADAVKIQLTAPSGQGGQCSSGTTCQAGMCTPSTDSSDPSVGAGCSLELIGTGPLARPWGVPENSTGTLISAPAIVATNTGFMVVYRRQDHANTYLVMMPLDTSGGVREQPKPADGTGALADRCGSPDENDGVGLVANGDDLRILLARPACTDNPAIEVFSAKLPQGEVGFPITTTRVSSKSPTADAITLSSARSASSRPSGDIMVFTEGGVGRLGKIDPVGGVVAPYGTFGGTSGITNAWVSANDKIIALLAAGPPTSPPALDGGTDGGTDGGGDPAPPTTVPELRLLVVPSDTAFDTIDISKSTPRPPITLPGTFGSVATVLGRAIVVSDSATEGQGVSFRAYDLGNEFATNENGFDVEGEGKVTATDVFVLGNRAYIVALKEHAVALHVYDNATTTITPLRDVSFAHVPRISAINTVRDGRVAVAATATRVAVAWTTTSVLQQYDGAGGYAVFACGK